MQTLRTTARVDTDGLLHLELPVGSAGDEFEVIVVLQPKTLEGSVERPEELSWDEFIARTAGAWEGEFARDQGTYEERDSP